MSWIWIAALAGGALGQEPKQGTAPPQPTTTAQQQEAVIDPRADAQLKKMSEYLGGLKTFRVDTVAIDEKVSTEGQKIQELKQSTVTVRRPGMLRVDRLGPAGHVTLRVDGKNAVLFHQDRNQYGTAPVPASLDRSVDSLRERLHIDAPAGDFLYTDSYSGFIDGVKVGRYIGLEPIDNVMAHHLAMSGDKIDWQVWIRDGDQPTPLRYVITSKDMRSQPQFTLEMRNWQPNVSVSEDLFSFVPPQNAKRIQLNPPTAQGRTP
jgi:hypothetical protein